MKSSRDSVSIMPGRVQTIPHELGEFTDGIGLRKKIAVFQQGGVTAGHAGAVAAGVDHFQSWTTAGKLFRQLAAHHAAGHNQVGEQQIHRAVRLLPNLKSVYSGSSLEHRVSLGPKDLHYHAA